MFTRAKNRKLAERMRRSDRGRGKFSAFCAISIAAAFLLCMTFPLGQVQAQDSSHTWDFGTPSDYSYDSQLVEISGDTAHTAAFPLEDGWWTKIYHGGHGPDDAKSVSCDPDGNPVVAGYVNNGTNTDIWVRKYSGSDGATLWTKTYHGGFGYDVAYGVSCDSDGNPVVAGYVDNGTDLDIWVRKYQGSDGATLWTKTYHGGSGNDIAYGVSCDSDGNPVVAGNVNNGIDDDIWVRKYQGSDGATLWTKTYHGGSGQDVAYGVSCDSDGNPVVAGYVYNGTDLDIWVRKYQGSDGSTLWTKTYDSGYGSDRAYGVSCDSDGDPVVAGYVNNGTNNDIWVGKYQGSDGTTLWTETYDGGSGSDVAHGVSCDSYGNPVVTGFVFNGTDDDIWVRKYPAWEYSPSSPTVTTDTGANLSELNLSGFQETAGGGNQGTITYQLSPDNSNWYYYDGGWNKYTLAGVFGAAPSNTDSASEVNQRISEFNSIATDKLYVRAFLNSNGVQKVELDEITVTLEYTSPTIASISPSSALNDGIVHIDNLSGTNFRDGAIVMLARTQGTGSATTQTITATDVNVVSEEKITCFFDLTRVTTGAWDVVVENDDGEQGRMDDAFEVGLGATLWHLPEGYTGDGNYPGEKFDTYVLIQNPTEEAALIRATYMLPGGDTIERDYEVSPHARYTIHLDDIEELANTSVSTRIECINGVAIICERAMYFNYYGIKGGHDSIGINSPSGLWYLAEGYTGNNNYPGERFDTYVLIQNPGDTDANILVTYMLPSGETIEENLTVLSNERYTIHLDEIAGLENTSVSTKIESTNNVGVVCERAEYFNYYGKEGGHDSIGARSTSTSWYLAEGYTGDNNYPGESFDTYVLIQNPSEVDSVLRVTYMLPGGDTIQEELVVASHSRHTIYLDDIEGLSNTAVSTLIESANDVPIACERAMYFNYYGKEGGHDSIGVRSPATRWYQAEGYTGKNNYSYEGIPESFDTYTLIQNPTDFDTMVRVSYMFEDRGIISIDYPILANSRFTIHANDIPGCENSSLSIRIVSLDDVPIICERAMYFAFYGDMGGHDSLSYTY